jgi:hypothetical protein
MIANHKHPLVKEYYKTGKINTTRTHLKVGIAENVKTGQLPNSRRSTRTLGGQAPSRHMMRRLN